jgi:hypothetical protein
MTTTYSSRKINLSDVEQVVAEPLRFKAKLAIGENAYTSLRAANKMRELWDVLGAASTGAAVANSSLVAGTFFAPTGLLGALGIGTAATPIGWIAFAAIASGGACYGIYRLLDQSKDTRIIEIPRYLNTPLDTLGLALFDLLAPMALRLAAVDGAVSTAKRQRLIEHLIDDWGLDIDFVTQALAAIETAAVQGSLEKMATEAASFLYANPDCNHEEIAKEYTEFLHEMLETDGAVTPEQISYLRLVAQQLKAAPPSKLVQHLSRASDQVSQVSGQVKTVVTKAAQQTWDKLPTPSELSIQATQILDEAQQAAKTVGRHVEKSVDELSRSAQSLIRKVTRRF